MFFRQTLSIAGILLTLVGVFAGWVGVSLALAIGLMLALTLGNPWPAQSGKWAGWLLKTAVVGLGFGLPLDVVLGTAFDSLLLTIATIAGALLLGRWLATLFAIDRTLGQLLAAGTAICGGSAIAALAPVLKARGEHIAISLAVVFLLNGLALWLFPVLGHWLGLSDQQFGLWAALAIHDTSSVVGAATAFSEQALPVATTAKLARAVWIVPLVLLFSWRQRDEGEAITIPMFIALFLLASLARTLVPALAEFAPLLTTIAKQLFAVSLLLIGYGLTFPVLRQIDWRSLAMAVTLWLLLASASLFALINGWY